MRNFHLSLKNSIITASAALLVIAAPMSAAILGEAVNYGILGGSGVTFAGSDTNVAGNVGVYPGSSITGAGTVTFPSGYGIDNLNAATAHSDLSSAMTLLNSLSITNSSYSTTGILSGTLTAGVYDLGSSASWSGNILLDAGGSSNAIFVFLIDSTLISASSSTVSITNGSASVYWVVGSSATLGYNSSIVGNILAYTSITIAPYSDVYGRTLALNGAITAGGNNIVDLTNANDGLGTLVPEPSAYALIGSSIVLGFVALRRRHTRINVA